MKKEIAQKITEKAKEIATIFSSTERDFNYNKETFELTNIIPLSEYSVAAIYKKQPCGKLAVFYIQHINTGNGGFIQYFCVKYQHMLDFDEMKRIMYDVEKHNFPRNFDEGQKNLEDWYK